LLLNVACGLLFPLIVVPIQTYVQTTVEDGMLGRVNAAFGMVGMAAIPVSNAFAGQFLASYGPKVLFLTMGFGMLTATLIGLFSKPYIKAEIPQQTSVASERP
jgi:Zn-dependent protease